MSKGRPTVLAFQTSDPVVELLPVVPWPYLEEAKGAIRILKAVHDGRTGQSPAEGRYELRDGARHSRLPELESERK